VNAIDHLIRTRQIEYVQVGSQRGQVIPIKSLDKFIEKRTQATADEELRKRGKR
jgi:hypothetical protein